jgi:RNA polymerase sigma factor (sigma-70 family)
MEQTPASRRALVAAAQAGAPADREAFVEAFLPLIGSIASRYRNARAVDRAELMQAGVLGLLRALERYDLDLGTPFWAYAQWWVREAMQELVAELEWPMVLSDRALRQLAGVRRARSEHLQCERREPSRAELARAAGMSRDKLVRLLASERPARGLEEPVARDREGSPLAELVADEAAQDAYDRVLLRVVAAEVGELVDELEARERWVVRHHFGLDGPSRTLTELGEILGVSSERVRQVEARALEQLRSRLEHDAATPSWRHSFSSSQPRNRSASSTSVSSGSAVGSIMSGSSGGLLD